MVRIQHFSRLCSTYSSNTISSSREMSYRGPTALVLLSMSFHGHTLGVGEESLQAVYQTCPGTVGILWVFLFSLFFGGLCIEFFVYFVHGKCNDLDILSFGKSGDGGGPNFFDVSSFLGNTFRDYWNLGGCAYAGALNGIKLNVG